MMPDHSLGLQRLASIGQLKFDGHPLSGLNLGRQDGWYWQRGILEVRLVETANNRVRGTKRWTLHAEENHCRQEAGVSARKRSKPAGATRSHLGSML